MLGAGPPVLGWPPKNGLEAIDFKVSFAPPPFLTIGFYIPGAKIRIHKIRDGFCKEVVLLQMPVFLVSFPLGDLVK